MKLTASGIFAARMLLLACVLPHAALAPSAWLFGVNWKQEKVAWFCEVRGIAQQALPTKIYTGKDQTRTERYFVDKYPIRIDPQTGKVAFCYLDDGIYTPPGFATWLRQYTPLIHALSG